MRQGKDTWIITSAPSECGCEHQISKLVLPNPSWGGGAAYIARLHYWRGDHFSYSEVNPSYPKSEQYSIWPDRLEATRWIVYVVLLPDYEMFRPIALATWNILLVGAGWSVIRPLRRLSRCSLRHLWRFSIHSANAESNWVRTPGSWWAESACGKWLWLPCHPCRGPTWHVARVWAYSFNDAGQMQGRALPGSKPKLYVSHQTALAYFI